MDRNEYAQLPEEVKLDIKKIRGVEDIVVVLWLLEEVRAQPEGPFVTAPRRPFDNLVGPELITASSELAALEAVLETLLHVQMSVKATALTPDELRLFSAYPGELRALADMIETEIGQTTTTKGEVT